ncbi:hypothetical protein CKO28_03015 [Rhodovibrio sodomensis]|uniref:Uncharacterized protein n=1 Tax=Rhodovibrio sodomensis TaxID=1088 RepID=A0ABS1D9C1_9PROT|nr:hypothetical protein [Rhodovibrio sodomensis]MBK1667014.1 hypothetical protein [Rhodovibrio sodomensis]
MNRTSGRYLTSSRYPTETRNVWEIEWKSRHDGYAAISIDAETSRFLGIQLWGNGQLAQSQLNPDAAQELIDTLQAALRLYRGEKQETDQIDVDSQGKPTDPS